MAFPSLKKVEAAVGRLKLDIEKELKQKDSDLTAKDKEIAELKGKVDKDTSYWRKRYSEAMEAVEINQKQLNKLNKEIVDLNQKIATLEGDKDTGLMDKNALLKRINALESQVRAKRCIDCDDPATSFTGKKSGSRIELSSRDDGQIDGNYSYCNGKDREEKTESRKRFADIKPKIEVADDEPIQLEQSEDEPFFGDDFNGDEDSCYFCLKCQQPLNPSHDTDFLCNQCSFWNHTYCIRQAEKGKKVRKECLFCVNQKNDKKPSEMPMDPSAEPKKSKKFAEKVPSIKSFYWNLYDEKNDRVIKVGDCIYLGREGHDHISDMDKTDLDVFRITYLYIDKDGRKGFGGYHFFRPNETVRHLRKRFYQNELVAVPREDGFDYIDVIKGFCCVMDRTTFCQGRPRGFGETDIYICDQSYNKSTTAFKTLPKQFPILTDHYAFKSLHSISQPNRNCTFYYSNPSKKRKMQGVKGGYV